MILNAYAESALRKPRCGNSDLKMEFIPMRVFEHKDVSIPQTEKSKSNAVQVYFR